MKKINLRGVKFRSDEYREGFLAGFKFFSLKEGVRHQADRVQIAVDVENLSDIELPEGLDPYAWYQIDAPNQGTSVPKTGTEANGFETVYVTGQYTGKTESKNADRDDKSDG
jgi:hypothetical protein